jgi:hypothetical protein
MKDKIKKQYVNYVLENGHEPESVYKFAKKLKIEESDFYEHFNSFKQINMRATLSERSYFRFCLLSSKTPNESVVIFLK